MVHGITIGTTIGIIKVAAAQQGRAGGCKFRKKDPDELKGEGHVAMSGSRNRPVPALARLPFCIIHLTCRCGYRLDSPA